MSKVKDFFELLWTLLLILAFIYGEMVGIYHEIDKHDKVMVSILAPPYAWYRSIEIWWHQDEPIYVNSNYSSDIEKCNDIFQYKVNNYKVKNLCQEYSKIITEYSRERKTYIEEYSHNIIKLNIFTIFNYQDFILEEWDELYINENVLNTEKILTKYLHEKKIDELHIEIITEIDNYLEKISNEDVKIYTLKLLQLDSMYKNEAVLNYKLVFGDEFND